MTQHVAPHLWAEALAGRLAPKRRDAIERHAESCARCGRARDEVRRLTEAFATIRNEVAPAVGWDSVRARVHWSVSTAKHSQVGMRLVPRPLVRFGLAVGATAIVAGGTATYMASHSTRASEPAAAKRALPSSVTPIAAVITRLTGDIQIDGVRPSSQTAAFERSLGAGTVLATGAGSIDVQFGDASGLTVGPRSTLRMVRLDVAAIELDVDGSVDIDVRPRARGERFSVVAGNYTVEVRGTRFVVERDARGTRVACHHGLVAVRDQRNPGSLEVAAAHTAFLAADGGLTDVQPVPLRAAEIAQFARSAPWRAPVWTDLLAHSAPLDIIATSERNIRVDGVEVGVAPLQMRVMLGRHTIETADPAGRFHRAGWVDVAAAQSAAFEIADAVARPASASAARRKEQFAGGIDRARLQACTRPLAKSGLTDTVTIEISVDAQGAVNVLNVIDTDLPAEAAACVHDVLSDVRFGPGPAATWREQIGL